MTLKIVICEYVASGDFDFTNDKFLGHYHIQKNEKQIKHESYAVSVLRTLMIP